MVDFLILLCSALASLFKCRARLGVEILALRHQINILRRKAPRRVLLTSVDRLIFVSLYRLVPTIRDALAIVKPETVVRWHRAGFRVYWRWKSRSCGGRPKTAVEICRLIREMSLANPLWGAPRIHGELLKLGIDVGQTTVAKYMVRHRRPPSQGWQTFLRNHADGIASIDLFVVPTASFRLLYGFLMLRHGRRQILALGVTAHPTAEWIARQITEACGWERSPCHIIRDRDGVYGQVFTRRLRAMGIRDRPTSPRSPWQNAYAERLIGSIRRECLDHIVVFGERHLRRILESYTAYYNNLRTHLSLNKDTPVSRPIHAVGRIVSQPILAGLHHHYVRV
ncbi:MAG: transposase [Rhodospirillales bacterium]|nr:transposase [Rhodospirillales bacterium]